MVSNLYLIPVSCFLFVDTGASFYHCSNEYGDYSRVLLCLYSCFSVEGITSWVRITTYREML